MRFKSLLFVSLLTTFFICGCSSNNEDDPGDDPLDPVTYEEIGKDKASQFIIENYKLESAVKPSIKSVVSWDIVLDGDIAKNQVMKYVSNDEFEVKDKDAMYITEDRAILYKSELDELKDEPVIITMNSKFYEHYLSVFDANETACELGSDNSLRISSEVITDIKTLSYIHTYDSEGKETYYQEYIKIKDTIEYTIDIEFIYE